MLPKTEYADGISTSSSREVDVATKAQCSLPPKSRVLELEQRMLVQDRSAVANGDGSRAASGESVAAVKQEDDDEVSSDAEEDYESSTSGGEDETRPILPALPAPAGSLQEFVVDNFPKIVIGLLIFLSMLVFLMLRNRGETAALRCIDSVSQQIEEVPFPVVNFDAVKFKPIKGDYAALKAADKWVVALVSGSPTEEMRRLAKLDGWQVLAVATSGAPSDWEVPGVIFLSEEKQAALKYRIQAFISGDSPARKNVGYLFAIHHGARKIYDADERISLLGTLDKVFNVELDGPQSRREPFYQYRLVHNRTVVNPYVHFGQRSMWPRGFPIKLVGEASVEATYNEVSPGRHFVQQGLTNGFPDIDALFYYTRRSEREPVAVDFDMKAPPVALPQGTMAPVSSMNTLFHSPAFWSLMLPINMSPKACDIVRGYWGQRLLWEIGGMLVVYPPSAHRLDQLDTVFPEDEKDLHKNTERLLKFLMSWRSDKRTLFQKILHLSHSMAENGFWSARNVEFTAAWLQDLVSVGFHQPRLLALELGRVDPALYNSEHVQFVPEALPSVYLGIHESSALEKEMGDWLKWRRFFANIVLVLETSGDANGTALAWRMFYSRLFKHVVVMSQRPDPALRVENCSSHEPYELLPQVFDRYPHADGYLYLRDDAVFNYWNFVTCNRNKLWSLQKSKSAAWQTFMFKRTGSSWFLSASAKKNLRSGIRALPSKLLANYKRTMDDNRFVVSSSEAFYIPHRYVGDFRTLASLGAKFQLRTEVAIPLFFLAMDRPLNYDPEAFKLVVELGNSRRDPAMFYRRNRHLVHPWKAGNESEVTRRLRIMTAGDPILVEVL